MWQLHFPLNKSKQEQYRKPQWQLRLDKDLPFIILYIYGFAFQVLLSQASHLDVLLDRPVWLPLISSNDQLASMLI